MRGSLLLSIMLATGCSEYGFLGPHRDDQPPESETPGGTPDAPGDTDDPIANGEPDCDLAGEIAVHDLPILNTWDFDAEGRALAVSNSLTGIGYDILGYQLDGTREPVASSFATSDVWPRRPRALPDGDFVYIVRNPDADSIDGYSRLGLYDQSEGRELRLTEPDFYVFAIEPDVDGTVYVYGAPIIGSNQVDHAQIRRYDLYSGFSLPIIELDDPPYFRVGDIALSPDNDVLYLAGAFASDSTGVVYAVPRLDSWVWGEPVEIWSGGQAIHGIAVDACNNLYISEGERLLVLAPGADEAAHILDLPGYLVQPYWGSGGGDADTNVLFGNWWRGTDDLESWGFVGIQLGVDGTHILAE